MKIREFDLAAMDSMYGVVHLASSLLSAARSMKEDIVESSSRSPPSRTDVDKVPT